MTDQPREGGPPDSPVTRNAGEMSTHPATDAATAGKLGAPPGTIATGDEVGPGTEGVPRDPSITVSAQDEHWRKSFAERDYTDRDRGYEHYLPAYRYGWESRAERRDERFEDAEAELRKGWDSEATGLEWEEAKPAVRDAWDRTGTAAGDNIGRTDPGNPLA